MKYLLVLILSISIVIFLAGCSDESADNDDGNNSGSFTTENVKEAGDQFFSFSTNTASADEPESYDLKFTISTRTLEVGVNTCTFYRVGTDPLIMAGENVTIARLEAESLDDVTEIPPSENFLSDDPANTAVIGSNWLDQTFSINPDVYVLKSCDGNYALLAFADYTYDPSVHQITAIKFYYKYNDNGSMDFTSTPLDSFTTDNAYTQNRYFSFTEGNISFAYGTWHLQFTGSEVWLGPSCSTMKLENTDINDVSTISAPAFEHDVWPYYVTAGWYDTDQNMKVFALDYVYIVHTQDDKFAAFELTSYYDGMGNSGAFSFNWKYLNN